MSRLWERPGRRSWRRAPPRSEAACAARRRRAGAPPPRRRQRWVRKPELPWFNGNAASARDASRSRAFIREAEQAGKARASLNDDSISSLAGDVFAGATGEGRADLLVEPPRRMRQHGVDLAGVGGQVVARYRHAAVAARHVVEQAFELVDILFHGLP